MQEKDNNFCDKRIRDLQSEVASNVRLIAHTKTRVREHFKKINRLTAYATEKAIKARLLYKS